MVSKQLLEQINEKLADTSTVITSAYAKLYTNDYKSYNWKDSLLAGIITLVVERSLQAVLIRLYSFETTETLFETEVYYNFASYFKKHNENYYTFPVPGGQILLNFQTLTAADSFCDYVKAYSPKETLKSRKSEQDIENSDSNWLKSLKSRILQKKEKSDKGKLEISKPYAVQRVSSVEWDEITGTYVLDSLPGELRRIFVNDMKVKSGENSLYTSGLKSLGESKDESRKSTLKSGRTTNAGRNKKVGSFAELEEQILGSRKVTVTEYETAGKEKTGGSNYYSLLASKIAERRAELVKYNISEEGSESSSNNV